MMSGIGILDDLCLEVLMLDRDGRVVHATPSAESLLRSSTTSSSTTLHALLSYLNPDWLAQDLMESALDGSWTGTALLTVPDGRNRWVNIQACRAPERAFRDCAVLVFLTDITEQVDDVRRASRWATLGELLAGAAHNFGNVLMAIQGTLDSVVESPDRSQLPDGVEAKLRAALKHVGRGSDLLHRLLTFSRGSEPTPTRVSLSEVVESAMMLCKSHSATKGRTISNLVNPDFPRVRAHPDSLQEVVLNLVLNSLQATEPGGQVRIEADVMEDEPCAVLRVVDNGCGISPEAQSRLFEPFFSTKGGTGLGLPTSMALVNRMGGRISVESKPGLGTTFSVTLGLADSASQRDSLAA